MEVKPIKTRIFASGDDLLSFLGQYFLDIPERSVLVIASKIVALSQGRIVPMVDSLATAAALCMGEGSERRPLAIIRQAPVNYCNNVNKNELRMSEQNDMYEPLLRVLNN